MLTLARYRLHAQAETPIHLPEWPASTLRGAWGHALRRLACMTREKDCQACPLHSSCPYPALFAPPQHRDQRGQTLQPPPPYLIEPASWGERHLQTGEDFHFDLVLFGRALNELPLILLAWRHALHNGLGRGEGRARLNAVSHHPAAAPATTVHIPEEGKIQPHTPDQIGTDLPSHPCHRLTLHLQTPLRLHENGKALPPARLEAQHLLLAAIRRASLVCQIHGQGNPTWDYPSLKHTANTVNSQKSLKWQDWTRHSSRQQQRMQLGGVIGTWTLHAPHTSLTPFLPALHLGQWLHIGKETVFGLGRYQLHEDNTAPSTKNCEPLMQETDLTDKIPTLPFKYSPDF